MNTADLLKRMKDLINSTDFLSRHRINEKAFSRKRILNFHVTISIILNLVRDSISAELDKFSDYFKILEPTKSAFSQARHKIKETAFIELNDTLIKEYYKSNVKIMPRKKCFFNNLTLVAIDGYDLQLPLNDKVKEHFGYATNASNKLMPMSKASELYDLENGLTISAFNMPYAMGEREIAIKLIEDFIKKNINQKEFVFIFDRGYPSLFLMAYLISLGIKFVIRCSTQFRSEVNKAVDSRIKDQIVKLPLKKLEKEEKKQLVDRFPEINLSSELTIRVCLVKLETGNTEILLTSLINKKTFPHKLFKKLYSKRWGVETDIGFQKNRIEIENFSGESILAVQQEFYGAILWKNVANMLIAEAEAELFKIQLESEEELIDDESTCESLELEIDSKCELIKKETSNKIGHGKQIICMSSIYEPSNIENLLNKKELILKKEDKGINLELIQKNIDSLALKELTIVSKKIPSICDKAINRSIAYSRLKNRFIRALFDPDVDMDNFCDTMKKLMKKNIEPIRPGRKYEHKRQYPGKKFHKNSRRAI